MNTLGNIKGTKITKEESYAITHSFVCDTKVENGVMVKLKADGEVTPVTSDADQPLGMVTVGNKAADEKVTVITPFAAVVTGEADGAVTTGQQVAQTGINTAGTNAKFKTAAAGKYVSGIALSTAVTGAEVIVGIVRLTYKA